MVKNESEKVREIDEQILEELRKNLKMNIENPSILDNVNVISTEEKQKILRKIEEKRKCIFLLFQGSFTLNEQNIKEINPKINQKSDVYERIANNVILKRVEKIFNIMISNKEKDHRLISVCSDRHFFIKTVISENIPTSLIESCVGVEEREL